MEKKKSISLGRRAVDGLLLVVRAEIHDRNIKALTDSSAIRCFAAPACVATCGLKGEPRDVFLELVNGEKFLSRGFIPNVLIVTASVPVKAGWTVMSLLHEMGLVLGMTCLQLVNTELTGGSGRLYIPNGVQTAFTAG